MRRPRVVLLAFATLFLLTGTVGAADARLSADRLTIFAASSLAEVFPTIDPEPAYSFAGSNTLEAQIRQGAPADVFASASPANTQRLFAAGLVETPVTFTANRLALIVPRDNPAGLTSVYDLKAKPLKLVVAGAAVPVGAYTRTVLQRLGLAGVIDSVVSQEPDVKGVVGKVALGQADAGFVYVTDARTVADRVTVIRIPAWAQPRVRYEVAVVAASKRAPRARAWVATLLSPRGQAALRAAGFLPLASHR